MNSHFRCRFEFAFSLEVSEENILMNKGQVNLFNSQDWSSLLKANGLKQWAQPMQEYMLKEE